MPQGSRKELGLTAPWSDCIYIRHVSCGGYGIRSTVAALGNVQPPVGGPLVVYNYCPDCQLRCPVAEEHWRQSTQGDTYSSVERGGESGALLLASYPTEARKPASGPVVTYSLPARGDERNTETLVSICRTRRTENTRAYNGLWPNKIRLLRIGC